MRTGQPIIGRPAWYDRNPRQVLRQFFGEYLPPHSATQRWSYTVPSGRKAFVEILYARVIRVTQASTPGPVRAHIFLTPQGGSSQVICSATIYSNNLFDNDKVLTGQSMILFAGDAIEAYTLDDSTGGSCCYQVSAKITEFDA